MRLWDCPRCAMAKGPQLFSGGGAETTWAGLAGSLKRRLPKALGQAYPPRLAWDSGACPKTDPFYLNSASLTERSFFWPGCTAWPLFQRFGDFQEGKFGRDGPFIEKKSAAAHRKNPFTPQCFGENKK